MKTARVLASIALTLAVAAAAAEGIQSRTVYTTAAVGDGSMTFTVDGAVYGPWRAIVGLPAFFPGSAHWGMLVATLDRGWALIVDGKAEGSWKGADYENVSDLAMSPDGKTRSVRADLPGSALVRSVRIVNGKPYGPYEMVERPTFSPSGGGWAFRANAGSDRFLIANGKRFGPYRGFMDPSFEPDGKVSIVAMGEAGSKVIVDGKEYGPFAEAELLYSGDGNCLGYWAQRKAGGQQWTVAKKTYGPYDYVDRGRAWFGMDGKDWLVRVYKGSSSILLQSGKETVLGRLDTPGLPGGYLYTYEEGMGQFVVFNSSKSGPYETARGLTWTSDGSAWAMMHKTYPKGAGRTLSFVAVNGMSYPGSGLVKLAGREGFAWASGGFESDGIVQYWKDGAISSKTVFKVEGAAGAWTVSAGGVSVVPYDEIVGDPVIDPTGSHWGLLALRTAGVYAVVVDGKEAGLFAFERAVDFFHERARRRLVLHRLPEMGGAEFAHAGSRRAGLRPVPRLRPGFVLRRW